MSRVIKTLADETPAERTLERIVKGFSNHRRIQILRLLEAEPNLSVDSICQRLRIQFTTAAEHLRRATIAGLIAKQNRGRWVHHTLTPRGEQVLAFLNTLE
jgi:DNA-binding transcriptional ArsR family regulator